jgi:hypothetical protein
MTTRLLLRRHLTLVYPTERVYTRHDPADELGRAIMSIGSPPVEILVGARRYGIHNWEMTIDSDRLAVAWIPRDDLPPLLPPLGWRIRWRLRHLLRKWW